MSEIPNVDSLSHGDFRCQILDRLKLLLDHLPRQLPIRTELSIASDKGAGTRGPSKPANPGRKISVSEAFDNW
jgi:hypothetical protein